MSSYYFGVKETEPEKRELRPRKPVSFKPEPPSKKKDRTLHDTERYFQMVFVEENGGLSGPRAYNALQIINNPVFSGGKYNANGSVITESIILDNIKIHESEIPNSGNIYLRFYNVAVDAIPGGPILQGIETFLNDTVHLDTSTKNWYPLIRTDRVENIKLGGEGEVRKVETAAGIQLKTGKHIVRVTNKTFGKFPLVCVRTMIKGHLQDILATFAYSEADPRIAELLPTTTDTFVEMAPGEFLEELPPLEQDNMTFSQQELDDFLKLKIPSFGKHSLNLKSINSDIIYLKGKINN